MASAKSDLRVVLSLFDRLDQDPAGERDPELTKTSLTRFRESVRRDLEALLNARNVYFDLPPHFVEAGRSVLVYGLPDFTTLNVDSAVDQQKLCAEIQRVIEVFEPRLADVTADIPKLAGTERSLRVRIEGRLRLDAGAEHVTFDVVMPLGAGKYEIRDGR